MASTTFLENFGTIADAEGGISELRRMILDLGSRGLLTSDEVVQMRSADGEEPFAVPSGWAWHRLEEVTELIADGTHQTPTYVDSGIPFLSIKDISGGRLDFEKCRKIPEGEHLEINRRCNPSRGDVLICRIGTLGKAVVVDTDQRFSVFVSLGVIRPNSDLLSAFLCMALNSPWSYAQFERIKAGGSHASKLNLNSLRSCRFPLPPIEEQKRIVAKVDELMALCDELEEKQQRKATVTTKLRGSAFNALRKAETPDDLAAAWERISTNWSHLTNHPDSIPELRQTILELAMSGELAGSADGEPEDSPRRLLSEAIELVSGQHLGPDEYNGDQVGIPYLTGPADFTESGPVASRWTLERRAVARAGDVLITVKGAGVGKTAVLEVGEAAISRQLMAARPILFGTTYLKMLLDSLGSRLRDAQVGIAIPGIGRKDILNVKVSVPPLGQQVHVERLFMRLMAMCDELEKQLLHQQDLSSRLAIASTRLAG